MDEIQNPHYLSKFCGKEGENYHVRAYLSFIQYRSTTIVCNLEVILFGSFDTKSSFKDPQLSLVIITSYLELCKAIFYLLYIS